MCMLENTSLYAESILVRVDARGQRMGHLMVGGLPTLRESKQYLRPLLWILNYPSVGSMYILDILVKLRR